ncbi:MAG: hypothetical protein BYD32DRAFT_462542 [Podila humilis]|nr:MAG: hypothetical protein BYD32DRAFT_462542 [Podila humilis]
MSTLLRARPFFTSRTSLISSFSRSQSPFIQRHSLECPSKNSFSTSAISYAIEKKQLNKKITIPKDPYLLSEKVVKFAKNGKLDEAITLVMESPKSRQSEVVWNHLIQESSKLGKTSQSWQLLNDMKKRSFEPSERTYTILLNALAINNSSPNSVSRAMELYRQMQGSEDTTPTLVHTNALLKVCSRKPDFNAMQEVYSGMPKAGPNAPDVVTFNTLIGSFARRGGDEGFQQAWKAWEDFLEAKSRRPDEVDLDQRLVDSILLACREAKSSGFVKRGYRLVEDLYGLALSGSQTSLSTGSAGKAVSPTKALGLGTALRKNDIQPRTVELLLSICSKLKEYPKGQQYINLIKKTYPDFKSDPQLIASTIHLQIASKEYQKAVETWDEISKLGLQHTPATFKQGLDAALKARNWDKTFEMYSEMKRLLHKNCDVDTTRHRPVNPVVHQQDAWTLMSTLKCAVKTKHIEEGLKILRETHWTKVVNNTRYPRANADLAAQAVNIYSASFKNQTKASKDESLSETTKDELAADVSRLEKELENAKVIEARLAQTLAAHDEEKSKKVAEERAHSPRRIGFARSHSPPSDSTSFEKSTTSSGEREIKEQEDGSGWRKVSSEEYSNRSSSWSSRSGSQQRSSKARVYSKDRPDRSQQRSRFDDAFRPSTRFSRESLE